MGNGVGVPQVGDLLMMDLSSKMTGVIKGVLLFLRIMIQFGRLNWKNALGVICDNGLIINREEIIFERMYVW